MNSPKEQASKAFKCNNGANEYVCEDCAKKYRDREPCNGASTYHNGDCYICGQHKVVGQSRKSFGFHHFI